MDIDVKTHGDDLFSAAAYNASPVRARSEAQERASVLIAGRTLSVGNVLASENAPFYVAIDVRDAVLGESPSQRQIDEFNADLKQLEDWKLVERRIEKMRVRGYRDNRRRKFRFRICDDAASLVEWLRARREEELNPRAVATDNLLGSLKSALGEMQRTLNRMKGGDVDANAARDVMYGIQRADDLTDEVAASLQKLDKHLDDFTRSAYDIGEAREVIDELTLFRDRFMNRIGRLRQEIVPEIDKLRTPRQLERLARCEAVFREESGKMRHIVSGRIPAPRDVLDMLMRFYGTDGKLQELMRRVSDSARNVWKKLSARLRELERRNRRLEDVSATCTSARASSRARLSRILPRAVSPSGRRRGLTSGRTHRARRARHPWTRLASAIWKPGSSRAGSSRRTTARASGCRPVQCRMTAISARSSSLRGA